MVFKIASKSFYLFQHIFIFFSNVLVITNRDDENVCVIDINKIII